MAQKALLIGVKNGIDTLIDSGDPRDIRNRFKHSDGEGFDCLEVFESTVGRSRRKTFVKPLSKPSTPPAPEPAEEAPADPGDSEAAPGEIEELVTIAKGDGRKQEVKEAREKLNAIGVGY